MSIYNRQIGKWYKSRKKIKEIFIITLLSKRRLSKEGMGCEGVDQWKVPRAKRQREGGVHTSVTSAFGTPTYEEEAWAAQ